MISQQQYSHNMLVGQLTPNRVLDEAVLNAMTQVDRADFVPAAYRKSAYMDEAVPLCEGREMLSPVLFARMLQYLQVQPDQTVLYVGAGKGYGPAIVSYLAEKVFAVEELQESAEQARKYFASHSASNVEVVTGSLVGGSPEHAPYARIFVEGALERLPQRLMEQLAEGGMLVSVHATARLRGERKVLGRITVLEKRDGRMLTHSHEDAGCLLLPGFESKTSFTF